DYYRFDRASHSLTGHRAGNQFRLGDLVQVKIAYVDIDRRELDFQIVRRLKKAAARPSTKRERAAREASEIDRPRRKRTKGSLAADETPRSRGKRVKKSRSDLGVRGSQKGKVNRKGRKKKS